MTTADPKSSATVQDAAHCLLIDGHGMLYRAFFAIPVMTTSAGRHTNALFGFIRMIQQAIRSWRPTHMAVVFDAGLPRHRLQLLESYKAQRPRMPENLREQKHYVLEFLDAFSIPALAVDGEEADDVIASITEHLTSDRRPKISIASGDKDLYQLVSPCVSLVAQAGKPVETGIADVCRKTGVEPGQIVDWLALTGDNADNIPGVPGIGARTAARLLQEYGKLETVWKKIDAIKPPSLRARLLDHRDLLMRNVALMTLRRDVPIGSWSWENLACRPPCEAAYREFFHQYELKSLEPETNEPAGRQERQGRLDL